jgi:lipoprotein-anchoring transpeptidase ErfK/SrfK
MDRHIPNSQPLRFKLGRSARPTALGVAASLGLGLVLLTSMACAAMEPVLGSLVGSTPSAPTSEYWSAVEISKPTQTKIPATPMPPAEPDETETVPPEAAPTPISEEPPVITMVIVEDEARDPGSAPAPEALDPNGKYVLVSISEQHLYAYENGQLVYSFVASTGMGNSTRAGSFRVLDKIPSAYGANWNIWMPNWLGIYWSGSLENGIHALPILPGGARLWAGFLGTPISYGCVVLGVDEATQLYDWAEVGTPVEIVW